MPYFITFAVANNYRSMIYPESFEQKIGFKEIRQQLKACCLSPLGQSLVDELAFSSDAEQVNRWMDETREMRRIGEEEDAFPLEGFFDERDAIKRVRLEGTWLEEDELFRLRQALKTIDGLVRFLYRGTEEDDSEGTDAFALKRWTYPALHDLADGIATFPVLVQQIDQIVDKTGHIRDNASPELAQIRHELARTAGSISRILNGILRAAQSEGVVEKDVAPTLRDGRLVIPVAPGLKRKISGIVHDESATGRTVYIEPTEVVEANNRIRELESDERHEIIRILTKMAARIRPHWREILDSFHFLAEIDLVQAKARLARTMRAVEPQVADHPLIDWIEACHPLLRRSLEAKGERIIPLEIMLTVEKHILIISGPNAGGKSVTLKTTGLLQYMLQCGLSIPVSERSHCGIFDDLMMDIGDEQSLENDLSTYSSHLVNMKNMMRQANPRTLILIDEFGTGTEPQIGGAIAESVLTQFCRKGAWAVITTHYQNLKHFADSHDGVANGAMLYDRHEMKPLFQLAIGRPGSSFAIEIARKIGLPEEVIQQASDIVGSDYIQSDKYLQDIVRDKRYWENKRAAIHQREKDIERTIARYEDGLQEVEAQRKQILAKAKQEAEELLASANKRIENTIREIREQQAEKEETRKIRAELDSFKKDVEEIDTKAEDDKIARKIAQIKARKERHAQRKAAKADEQQKAAEALREASRRQEKIANHIIEAGDMVRIQGTLSKGRVESVDGKMATVIIGQMRTKLPVKRLEAVLGEAGAAGTNGGAGNTKGAAGLGKAGLSDGELQKTANENGGAASGQGGRWPLDGEESSKFKAQSSKSSSQSSKFKVQSSKSKMDELREGLQSYSISRMTQDTIADHRKNFHQDLDVRGMRADEALTAVQYFIDDAILVGMPRVRILHGKGNGILRTLIRQYLSSEPNVTHYADEHVQFGGAGITVVDL